MIDASKFTVDVWNKRTEYRPDIVDALRTGEFRGIHIIGPNVVENVPVTSLPIVGFRLFRTDKVVVTDFARNAIVVAVHLETSNLKAALVRPPRNDVTSGPRAKPAKVADVAQQFDFDLIESLEKPLNEPGEWIVTVIVGNETSNRLRIFCGNSNGKTKTKTEARALSEFRPHAPIPFPNSKELYPYYDIHIEPATIPTMSFAIEIPLSREIAPDKCVLHGAFSLPGYSLDQVDSSPDEVEQWRSLADTDVLAVIDVKLFLVGEDIPGPFVIPLHLPAYVSRVNDGGEKEFLGKFEINLFAMNDMPRVPQRFFTWAFSGGAMFGPYQLELPIQNVR